MGTRERPADRGRRRAGELLRRLGEEHRQARAQAGLSLRAVAAASGRSHSQVSRFERGLLAAVSLGDVGAWCAVVGLDLAVRAYPGGDALRDAAHARLLSRLRVQLHPSVRWRAEVPLPIPGDQRAWDAAITGDRPRPWSGRVEAETRIADAQAVERKIGLKVRDDPGGHLILLLSDTRTNRAALEALEPGLRSILPLSGRAVLEALRRGEDPGAGGIVLL